MTIKNLSIGLTQIKELRQKIDYKKDNIAYYYPQIRQLKNAFILESKDISSIYGRLSLIGFDPLLKITGKNEDFQIELLNNRGKLFFEQSSEQDFAKITDFQKTEQKITAKIKKEQNIDLEENRSKKHTIADSLRIILDKFKTEQKTFLGLYGAFAYDFVRLYEDLPDLAQDQGDPDFCFYLYDSFLYFDHIKQEAEIVFYREQEIENDLIQFVQNNDQQKTVFEIKNSKFDLDQKDYEDLVKKAQQLAKQGDIFEVVFSRTMTADFAGDPFALYLAYREINPSPYMFYFDFDNEYLVGASPEMMLRVEEGIAHSRPISGTMPRGKNLIEDHENMLKLLSSEKERAELDMLIDLARNDLARICEAGIKITEYRTVERYSRVMHTIAHVQGKLKKDCTALDAYISCANAGTLTGAPKVQAMIEIERNEKTRRGYYGGAVGYLSLNGDMDTGIIIRTAHIKNNQLTLRAGATLLYSSDPTAEYKETQAKAQAFMDTFALK